MPTPTLRRATGCAPAGVLSPGAACATGLLGQCRCFLEGLHDDVYARESRTMMRGTIGKHTRHSLDHFAAALSGFGRHAEEIDYDHRQREVPMETSRAAAISAIRAMNDSLVSIGPEADGQPVRVRLMLSGDGALGAFTSTLGRELAFAAHHALHHHAMMRVIADEFGVVCPPDFGKAPSTVHFEHSTH